MCWITWRTRRKKRLSEIAMHEGDARCNATAQRIRARDHERFAMPVLEIDTQGGGEQDTGQLLDVTGANISAIRRRGEVLEVRVWNDTVTPRTAFVSGTAVDMGPAEICTVRVIGSEF